MNFCACVSKWCWTWVALDPGGFWPGEGTAAKSIPKISCMGSCQFSRLTKKSSKNPFYIYLYCFIFNYFYKAYFIGHNMSQPNGKKKHVADHHPSRRSLQTPLQTPREVTSLVTERGYISTTILPLSSSHQSIHPSISCLILSCNIRQDKIR